MGTFQIFCTLACNLTKSSVTVRLKEPWAVPNPLLTCLCGKKGGFPGTASEGSSPPASWPPASDFLRNPAAGAMLSARPGNGRTHLVRSHRPRTPEGQCPPLFAGDLTSSRLLRRGHSARLARAFGVPARRTKARRAGITQARSVVPARPRGPAAAAAAVATPRTGRPPHLSNGQWRSLPPTTTARRRPGRAAQAAGSGSSRRSASG
ncbi:PREDICTED: uncharacterized protein LOC103078191 [Lipotes vexillifer]|uniref:Uncharacterized protein LOC103078191 n=1 Tax=Lipotes vexillifer TaxID=118797 RepID=A0A340X860_LIPVE|nr:PREDICTED: uncharacterized protein LOC103078191 [Lipotes vexillifer]